MVGVMNIVKTVMMTLDPITDRVRLASMMSAAFAHSARAELRACTRASLHCCHARIDGSMPPAAKKACFRLVCQIYPTHYNYCCNQSNNC